MAVKRSKNFCTVAYPESISFPELKTFLDELHICYLISPLHDKDVVAEANNAPKKPHWHIVLIFDSLKSVPQVKDLMHPSTVGLEIVNSLVSYARYLVHMDNPEKAQYNIEDVVFYGIDYKQLCLKESDKYDAFGRLLDYVVAEHITSFSSLLLYAKHNDEPMFRALCDNSYTIREFLRSYRENIANTSHRPVKPH